MVSYIYTIQVSNRGDNSLQHGVAVDLMARMGHELSMAVADAFITEPQRNNGAYYIVFYHEGHRTLFAMLLDSLKVQYRFQQGKPRLVRIPPEVEEGIPAPFSKKSEVALGMHNWGQELLRIARGGL